ncbi:MAG: TadE/TadG family type IV pilus assembly protein [Hyphomicrobiales bacterium]
MSRRIFRDESGATAIIFSLALLPILGISGFAIDYSRANRVTQKMQDAADASALAAARQKKTTNAKLQEYAQAYFNANFDDDGVMATPKVKAKYVSAGVHVEVGGKVQTTLMDLFGVDAMHTKVESEVRQETGPTEIAIAFDTTNSMKFGNRWSEATRALGVLLEDLKKAAGGDDFRVSFVPFGDRVNTGVSRKDWVDDSYDLTSWNGCTEPREESISGWDWNLTDQTPSELPFTPSVPATYGPVKVIYGNQTPACPNVEIVEPTPSTALVEQRAGQMQAAGTGRFDIGMAWLHRLLSPEWAGVYGSPKWPRPLGESSKIAVFLSDGNTEAYRYEVGGEAGSVFGWNQGSQWGFENMVKVCDRMKLDGIEIHAIFVAGNPHFEAYLRDCATSDENFHRVEDVEALVGAFKKIGTRTTELRIVR